MPEDKRRGRRPQGEQNMRQIAIRLPVELLEEIEAMIAGRLDGMDKSTLIRTLLAEAVEARRKKPKK
ncbi:hypothetical protein [Thiocapsa sp. UBA6158]|uniref:hypothetical protein n=1 Tax=Thiocapsa sp. UBA6158 TaxID=1947692 RepID=UPI0025EEB838|nr:hypothetical protein [Thiocapsa sp. UBA6158]